MTRLDRLPVGGGGMVLGLGGNEGIRRRLLDLGLTRGAYLRCLFASPAGDPRAYLVRGAVVALRAADAAQVSLAEETETQTKRRGSGK